ncbi:MAG: 3-hydroxyacyl-[acyl-carrier-protein] dehydratase FabZ [Gammaproteobacteria bacterium]|nr:MAG: 3-hydroxyacyl-[acyl-carrier-protein] dehydratase FabZ [Gammaproteobacteria bacterium]
MAIRDILGQLPHRYPFLLVDRVLELDTGVRIRGLKNVTINEPFFPGHFPDQPVMPGVLIIEAMAQLAGVLALVSAGRTAGKDSIFYLAGVDKARFKRPVTPGDQLLMSAELLQQRRTLTRFACRAEVDGQLACEAEIMCVEAPAS